MVASPIHGLHAAATQAGDGAAVVACVGAVNSGATALLNAALRLQLPVPPRDSPVSAKLPSSPSKPVPPPDASPLRAAAVAAGPLALALEELDPADRARAADVDAALLLAVALSGAVVVPLRQAELIRPRSSALAAVLAAIERSLALRTAGLTPPLPARRLLVIAVRDFDPADADPAEVETFVTEFLSDSYDAFDVPSGFAGTQLSDLFDLRFCLLPQERIAPDEYADGVRRLGDMLRNANRDYADAGMTAGRLLSTVDRIQAATADNTSADLPSDRELSATFACSTVMQIVMDKYRNTAKQWKATVETGRIIRNFGKESDALVERTLQVFDKDATAHRGTRAFTRKKEELKSALLSDAYALFAKQILKLREVAYQVFRGKLARIRINDQVEKNVRGAVKEAELYFVENAESLRSNLGNWRFDNERHELVNHMRDDATERLQLARLQGNYVPPMRAPIAFAFHTLLLAPFGRDSRFAHPHAEEMQQSFDPDKIKQAGLMRARPQQRNFKFTVSGRNEVGQETVDTFADFFADAPASK